MDIIQSAITDKIRNSIKEKLKDLKLFVDDELPDYIMILVANKRSKHQMEKDLSLFLGNETSAFTNWLWDLVNNLKVGSKILQIKRSKQEELDSNTSADAPEFKENRAEEDDVLNYDPTEEGEFLRIEITGDSSSSQPREINQVNNSASKVIPEINNVSKTAVLNSSEVLIPDSVAVKEIPDSVKVEAIKKSDDISESSAVRKSVQKSAKVYPVQRVEEVPTSTSETKKLVYAGNVSSVVRVTQRKYSGPYALQQNKLLLKAVNDAAKSVLDGKDINDYFKPTPVNVFPSKVTGTFNAKEENCNAKLNQFEADKDSRTVKSLNQLKINIKADNCKGKEIEAHSLQHRQVIRLNADTTELDLMSENSNTSSPIDQGPTSLSDSEHQITPHFIVTLDGGNSSSLKRKRSSVELMDVDEDISSHESLDVVSTKKQKLKEKCKYWPACKNRDNCLFQHPTIPCKCFPKCKFGDKCVYIHPKCKFDSLCSREDCPYTHCKKRKVSAKIPVFTKPVVQGKLVCKYYPKCTDKSCRFLHLKPCRFGIHCCNPKCAFSHFKVPHRSLLKWKAH